MSWLAGYVSLSLREGIYRSGRRERLLAKRLAKLGESSRLSGVVRLSEASRLGDAVRSG